MLSLRLLAVAGTVLLFGAAAPADAGLSMNGQSANALTTNALLTTGSAIADLNGVVVQGVSLPQAISR